MRVDVATLWSTPDAPRPVDGPAVADVPDLEAWIRGMDRGARADLHGRTETQLLHGEPAEVIEDAGNGWVKVVAPWQPSPKDARGYRGWLRRSHLLPADTRGLADSVGVPSPAARLASDPTAIIAYAQGLRGLRYVWGGLSSHGLDCSGLVHLSYRQAGVVVPRDADAQHAVATQVPPGAERPGDLYFFAGQGRGVSHVGFVTGRLHMLHAPHEGGQVEDTPISARRLDTLVAAGRLATGAS